MTTALRGHNTGRAQGVLSDRIKPHGPQREQRGRCGQQRYAKRAAIGRLSSGTAASCGGHKGSQRAEEALPVVAARGRNRGPTGSARQAQPAAPSQEAPFDRSSQPADTRGVCELAIIGLSVAPPGFPDRPSLVQQPLPRDASAAAAARAAAALLRLTTAAACRLFEMQLGVTSVGLLVRRTWWTPGGRLATHVAVPSSLAARVLARKRWRLCGSPISVDLLRDRAELAAWKVGRQQQQQEGVALAPSVRGTNFMGPYLQAAMAVASAATVLPFSLVGLRCIPVVCTLYILLTLLLVLLAWCIVFPP